MSLPRVWLVTGCSSGFGQRFIRAILQRGDNAIATARRLESIKVLENEGAATLQLDVSSPASELQAIVGRAINIYGRVDVLVNNAGYGQFGAMEDLAYVDACTGRLHIADRLTSSPEVLLAQFQTNVFGPVNLARALLPHFRERNAGAIVLMSSVAAVVTAPGMGAYTASKAAVDCECIWASIPRYDCGSFNSADGSAIALFGALRLELAATPIRTIILQPGSFRTDLVAPGKVAVKILDSPLHGGLMEKTTNYMNSVHGKQPGDPSKLVEVAIELVTTGKYEGRDTPSKLTLGSDALAMTQKILKGRLEEMEEWKSASVSTDFEPSQ